MLRYSWQETKTQLKTLKIRNCYRIGIDGYITLKETLQQLIDELTKMIENGRE